MNFVQSTFLKVMTIGALITGGKAAAQDYVASSDPTATHVNTPAQNGSEDNERNRRIFSGNQWREKSHPIDYKNLMASTDPSVKADTTGINQQLGYKLKGVIFIKGNDNKVITVVHSTDTVENNLHGRTTIDQYRAYSSEKGEPYDIKSPELVERIFSQNGRELLTVNLAKKQREHMGVEMFVPYAHNMGKVPFLYFSAIHTDSIALEMLSKAQGQGNVSGARELFLQTLADGAYGNSSSQFGRENAVAQILKKQTQP